MWLAVRFLFFFFSILFWFFTAEPSYRVVPAVATLLHFSFSLNWLLLDWSGPRLCLFFIASFAELVADVPANEQSANNNDASTNSCLFICFS